MEFYGNDYSREDKIANDVIQNFKEITNYTLEESTNFFDKRQRDKVNEIYEKVRGYILKKYKIDMYEDEDLEEVISDVII